MHSVPGMDPLRLTEGQLQGDLIHVAPKEIQSKPQKRFIMVKFISASRMVKVKTLGI